ncbi:hypothetical protein ACJMK2_020217 [Sinanodonta woodiana]|uniref:Ankyrin repeat protein n=1 Tax=Sinanodonta woodiana TaxID=1069815 RepID=A0ABD3TYE1_SINWO
MDLTESLRDFIKAGELQNIQKLIGPITDFKLINAIDEQFVTQSSPSTDALNFAISCQQEPVAIYLVEKSFQIDRVFQVAGAQCDQWCMEGHGPSRCPKEYSATSQAQDKGMLRLKNLLDAIHHRNYKPGTGLTEPAVENHMPHPPAQREHKPNLQRPSPQVSTTRKKEVRPADIARSIVQSHGRLYSSKTGGSLLHMSIERDQPQVYVYIFAHAGVPVNIQDVNGDTALHLAVRRKRLDLVEALVQCCADISLRNKLGQTPLDEADLIVKQFLDMFEPPGLYCALFKSRDQAFGRIFRKSWCSVETVVKGKADGKTLISLVRERSEKDNKVWKCLRMLEDNEQSSLLIHAVLQEDVNMTRNILKKMKNKETLQSRFRDHKGKTLLSHAIEANNLELVQLLVENGANVNQIRVRESQEDITSDTSLTEATVPLFFKSIQADLDPNIAKYLDNVQKKIEHTEKDCEGNTVLFRAIIEGVPVSTLFWLMDTMSGSNLLDRNKNGLTAREFAEENGRPDVVQAIDRYILQNMNLNSWIQFPIRFYRPELLNITDEQSGKTFWEKLEEEKDNHNLKRVMDFAQTEKHAISLFEAAASGYLDQVKNLNDALYQDRNGYTAMIRAIVFNQLEIVNEFCISKPLLKSIPDNCNRYPLHYAYMLPREQGKPFIQLLLEKNAEAVESRMDKDGRVAAEFADFRNTADIQQMLYNARTLDAYGKRGPPLGPWPHGASKVPPTKTRGD